MTTEAEARGVTFSDVLDAFDAINMDGSASRRSLKELERVVRMNVEEFGGALEVLNERLAPAAAAADFKVTYSQDEEHLALTLKVVIMAEGDGFILFAANDPGESVDLVNTAQAAHWFFEQLVEVLKVSRTREFVVRHLTQEE